MKNLFLDILAFGTLLSSVLVITSKNPVIAVVFLISVFINAAGYLILLGVGFIGLSYILVYIGAIIVLFLFVIMMLNIKLSDILETGSHYTKNIPLALFIGSLFIYEFFTLLPFTTNDVTSLSALLDLVTNLNGLFLNSNSLIYNNIFTVVNPSIADTTITSFLHIESLAHALYTYGAMLLLILSIILLLAMIAPIYIAKDASHSQNSNI